MERERKKSSISLEEIKLLTTQFVRDCFIMALWRSTFMLNHFLLHESWPFWFEKKKKTLKTKNNTETKICLMNEDCDVTRSMVTELHFFPICYWIIYEFPFAFPVSSQELQRMSCLPLQYSFSLSSSSSYSIFLSIILHKLSASVNFIRLLARTVWLEHTLTYKWVTLTLLCIVTKYTRCSVSTDRNLSSGFAQK